MRRPSAKTPAAMRTRGLVVLVLGQVVTLSLIASACAEDDVSIPAATSDAAPSPTPNPTGTARPLDDASVDVDAASVVPCPNVAPDDADGVFVVAATAADAAVSADAADCGARAHPCRTIAEGLTAAKAASRSKVYLGRGAYVERVALTAGFELIGGWDVSGEAWKRTCTLPEQAAVIRAPAGESVTISATDLGGEARLTRLRVESRASAATPTESLYGIVATGSTTALVLTDVDVAVGDAGAGQNGAAASPAVAAPSTCAANDGAPGAPGTDGAGAGAGAFGPAGYTPTSGAAAAGAAAAGRAGAAGGASTCVTCGTCDLACTFIPSGLSPCSGAGTHGCGGGAGGAGAGGTGGGSSVGVFVWDATVTVNGGRIRSGDAGRGGDGSAGAVGAAGAAGAAGAQSDQCVVACKLEVDTTCTAEMGRAAGGVAGGAGGAGGKGGAGGGGSGGSSFAVYQGGVGVVLTPNVTLQHGAAGAGGGPTTGPGAPGAAANRIP